MSDDGEVIDLVGALTRDIRILREQVERLRAALQPFAAYANAVTPGWPDDTGCSLLFVQPDGTIEQRPTVTLGDCRRAAEALKGT